jgi:hypothetical protein
MHVSQPGFKSTGNSRCARHPAHTGRQVKHPLALSNCELPEEEERFARLSSDPVWVATTGVQVRQGIFQAVFDATFWTKSLISNGPSLSNSFSFAVSDNARLRR